MNNTELGIYVRTSEFHIKVGPNAQSISCQLRTRYFAYKRMEIGLPNTVVKNSTHLHHQGHTAREDLLHHQRYR